MSIPQDNFFKRNRENKTQPVTYWIHKPRRQLSNNSVAVLVPGRSLCAGVHPANFHTTVEQWLLDTISPLIATSCDCATLGVIDSTLRFDLP